jgi:hypothetical protein
MSEEGSGSGVERRSRSLGQDRRDCGLTYRACGDSGSQQHALCTPHVLSVRAGVHEILRDHTAPAVQRRTETGQLVCGVRLIGRVAPMR